jgi:N-acetylneuraminic acid mutarotase
MGQKHASSWIVVVVVVATSSLAWGAQIPTAEIQSNVAESGGASAPEAVSPPRGGAYLKDIGVAWEVMAPMPAGRVFNAVVASGPYIFVIGGTSDAGGLTPTNTVYRYDTAANTWATMTAMPAALNSIDGIEIGGVIYIPGGAADANTYAYNVAGDSWSTIPANGGYTGREQYQVVAIGTDLYVLGGITAGAATTQVWVLDTTTNTWSAGVPMQEPRTSFGAAAIDGSIYVAGGVNYPGFTPTMTAETFNGSSWSYIAPVPNGGGAYTRWSYNADGVGQDGLWLGAGRRDASWTVLNHAAYYDPDTNTWTDSPTVPALNQGRVYMEGAVGNDGYFYVIGGRDSAGSTVYANNERLATNGPIPVELQSLVVE